ncbi:MAG TPA: maltose alpha-D-glucosyltransferase [Dehalococcoidia bacterium]|jgi:maltose alpha-D-glucosyltransferase/alpha-amylase|nr:maltose alpha-D-glucosyltransferase [Dehalococcoidia bacterium]
MQSSGDSLWYKDAIIYQLHVRAFHDSNNDGVGDFRGLMQKLDYLQDLGVTALWLLPFYPSPLRDDGYDIADYTGVHPAYGTLRDFQAFLREAHRRGLRVITELVLNHTSDQHPWFQRARAAPPGSGARDFYVWNDSPERYGEARIIFKDFEASNWAWDAHAGAYYWHRFYSHQPDLNYENPETKRALLQVLDHWLGMGVDALRLDAVPYLYEREGTSCENLPETHEYLRDLRRHVDERFPGRVLLAEANQWPEDAIAYFGSGDECHMSFHFPLMPRLFMAVHMEDRFPIIDILQQTPAIPDDCQWAVFLRNHDELTLEMVTDEDRDYMYRVYAQDEEARVNLGIRRRLAPLLSNNRRRIELMNGLLFSLPGAPILYYGDEIGMGDNIYLGDRNGVRTPMQWSGDRNAGFSRANPQRLYMPVIMDPEYHYGTVNVEAQQNNPHSLLWWTRRLIALRKRYKAFGRGSIEFLFPENRKVLAFVRRYQNETMLFVANLSRFVQYVELDMSAYKGSVPVELFGRTEFPIVGDLPYFLTLGPHAFFWFSLEPRSADTTAAGAGGDAERAPVLVTVGSGNGILESVARSSLEKALPRYLRSARWFGGKARTIQAVEILDAIEVPPAEGGPEAHLLLIKLTYREGEPEAYLLTVAAARAVEADRIFREMPNSVIGYAADGDNGRPSAVLYEGMHDKRFASSLLEAIERRRRIKGSAGDVTASTTEVFRRARGNEIAALEPSPITAEQSNSSVVYGDKLILKLFRRPDQGVNPDLEVGRALTRRTPPVQVPAVAGYIEYRRNRGEPMTLGILQQYMPNEGDAWSYTLDNAAAYLESALGVTEERELGGEAFPYGHVADLASREAPNEIRNLIGPYLQSVSLLGQRTAELHLALADTKEPSAFKPEPFTPPYQRSMYQSNRGLMAAVFPSLRRRLDSLQDGARDDARTLLGLESEALQRFQTILNAQLSGMRIRCHGDYHLGQVLFTGKDFVIIDFEGEPARPLSQRRLKKSPLTDVAGMLRSFSYAAHASLRDQVARGIIPTERASALEKWAQIWELWVGATFLREYRQVMGESPVVPQADDEIRLLLNVLLLEKALYEVNYELNNRPDWLSIPLRGVLQELGSHVRA